jgi:mRNA-degrading endonuclease RelE of RelBE toxin-antitoxin system
MIASWRVEFTASGRREFKSLGFREKEAAVRAIGELTEDPTPAGAIALRGYRNLYRFRFYRDRFRLIYYVSEKQRTIVITRVRPRGNAYIGMHEG